MARARTESKGVRSLTVSATLHGVEAEDDAPALAAYAFSGGGELLSSARLEDGRARLAVPEGKEAQSVRVVVGPVASDEDEPSLDELVRRGAVETHLRVDPGAELKPVAFPPIDGSTWRCWLDFCFVRGTLLKRVLRDGVWIDLPVCGATVDVWEVEPVEIVLPKIPIDVIDRLRGVVLKPPPLPDPPFRSGGIPIPPPGPGPDPAPFLALASTRVLAAPPPQGEAGEEQAALAGAVRALGADESVRSAALSGVEAFRGALLDRADLVRPLLCVLFPRFVTTTHIGRAETDDCGHFSTSVWRGCRPLNLYFTAWQWRFGGFDPVPFSILRPTPVGCYTHWNYACGTEVTLYTSSPFARTCAPCPPVIADPRWVLAMAVGNWPVSRIHGLSTATPGNGSNDGLTDGGAPFGGDLRLRLEFDDALAGIGVRYYRVSWKRAGTADAPQPLTAEVHRHYAHEVAGSLVDDVYSLGPRTVGATSSLFEIPPAMPPQGKWSYPDAVSDLTNAVLPSASYFPSPASGRIELHVDLFDGAGSPVDIAALGVNYVVPTSTDFSGTIHTENAAADGLVSGSTLVLPLYVDNNVTSAAIDAPTLNGSPASDECGVLEYGDDAGDSVTLAYHAHHPNGFATYGFALYRGVTELVPPSRSGPVGAGNFTATETAATLLGDCSIAGYSENLTAWATAIDGWRRLSEYDRSAVRAFVLAPEGSD